MAGCKALTDLEIGLVTKELPNKRNLLLFLLGLRTGFRISELLSLKVSDLVVGGKCVEAIKVEAKSMKGKRQCRAVPAHSDVKSLVNQLVASNTPWIQNPSHYLFKSPRGYNQPITRLQAHNILKDAYEVAGIVGQTGTHCMRKTFAAKVYKALNNDILKTQKALGHRLITSTINYLAVDQDEIDQAILGL